MLVGLGFLMIATFMYLIMSKRLMPVAALTLVPVLFGLLAGAGLGVGDMIVDGIVKLAPNAGLMFFAIIFFGLMIDVGLFDPLIRLIVRISGGDPLKLVMGTMLLTTCVSLDGDGSTTFIIVTSALLPIYLRLGMNPVVLTVIAATSNGVLNTVPWGSATVRAASALHLSPVDIFVPMIPAIAAGLVALAGLAYLLGRSERRRLTRQTVESLYGVESGGSPVQVTTSGGARSATEAEMATMLDEQLHRPNGRPRLRWVNLVITVVTMVLLVVNLTKPVVVLMLAAILALVINFPRVQEQADQFKAHASSVVSVVGLIFAAAVLTGIMSGTGMDVAMAQWISDAIPSSLGSHLPLIVGLLSLPVCFFMGNDAFFFGILPVLSATAAKSGVEPIEMARAALVGQPLLLSSPLVPAFLLLVSLAKVQISDHHRKVAVRACFVGLTILLVGGLTGGYSL